MPTGDVYEVAGSLRSLTGVPSEPSALEVLETDGGLRVLVASEGTDQLFLFDLPPDVDPDEPEVPDSKEDPSVPATNEGPNRLPLLDPPDDVSPGGLPRPPAPETVPTATPVEGAPLLVVTTLLAGEPAVESEAPQDAEGEDAGPLLAALSEASGPGPLNGGGDEAEEVESEGEPEVPEVAGPNLDDAAAGARLVQPGDSDETGEEAGTEPVPKEDPADEPVRPPGEKEPDEETPWAFAEPYDFPSKEVPFPTPEGLCPQGGGSDSAVSASAVTTVIDQAMRALAALGLSSLLEWTRDAAHQPHSTRTRGRPFKTKH